MKKLLHYSKFLLGIFFIIAGISHFANTPFFLKIVPPYLPYPLLLVYVSGIAEVLLGGSLLFRQTQKWAAWGIIILLIAVFPANIYMAQHPELFPEFAKIGLYFRLPIQGLLILWVYQFTKKA